MITELFIFRTCGWCQSPGTEGCERSVNRTESENLRRGLAQQNLWTKASHQDQDRDRCDSNKSSKSMFFFSIFYKIIFKLLFAENYKIICLHTYPFCAPKEAWGCLTKDSTYDGSCQQPDQGSQQKEKIFLPFYFHLIIPHSLLTHINFFILFFILRTNTVKVTTLSSMDNPRAPVVARPGREVESPTRVHTVKTSEAVSHHCLLRCLTLVR